MARCYGAGARSANGDSRARPGDRMAVGKSCISVFSVCDVKTRYRVSSLLENMVFALTL